MSTEYDCPYCNAHMNQITLTDGDGHIPDTGDIGVCAACFCPFKFDENKKPRKLTTEETVEVNTMLDQMPEVDREVRLKHDKDNARLLLGELRNMLEAGAQCLCPKCIGNYQGPLNAVIVVLKRKHERNT